MRKVAMNKFNAAYRVGLFIATKGMILPMPDRLCSDAGGKCFAVPQTLADTSIRNAGFSTRTRYVHTAQPFRTKEHLLKRILKKCGVKTEKYVLAIQGNALYNRMVDELNYSKFYKEFNMADTFSSWYLVTELHVWMVICRAMADKEAGPVLRQYIVARMWEDVTQRADMLGPINSKTKNKQLNELSQHFNAALLEYDEGIMSDDMVLAGALWRTYFSLECNNPEQVEKLLLYVRKQISALDKQSLKEILRASRVKWLDFDFSG